MSSTTIAVERGPDGQIAIVRLDRPESRNAMNTELATELSAQLSELARAMELRVVVLTGTGERAFCAGADLKERAGMTDEEWLAQHEIFEKAFMSLRCFPKPIFAAVNGVAAGGGLELALCTDFIIAADNARLGAPEVRVGIIPGGGATQLLPNLVPLGLARQLLMTGELIDARSALAAGLVNSVHPQEELLEAALSLARSIARNSPAAVRAVRAAVNDGLGVPPEVGVAAYLAHYRRLVALPDRHEGVAAFNEKRDPAFPDLQPPDPKQ